MSPTKILPTSTLARLFAYCDATGEDPEAVIIDAVDLHLDAIEEGVEHQSIIAAAPARREVSA